MCKDSNYTVAREPYLSTLLLTVSALLLSVSGLLAISTRLLAISALLTLVERFDAVKFGIFQRNLSNFRGLVLFCIEADFCNQILIF